MTIPTPVRPAHPELAKLFDQAIQSGQEIRYVDETRLVVFRKNSWGCGGIIFLVIIGLLTAFIVPIILFFMGALAPGGRVITYEVQKNGKVKQSVTG